uniref:Peptidase A1 domain-containing protein n=1 Tax=Rhabditophanes sp. KR3021 TaxID=114890 RepID=A0AC35UD00_9BILA
MIMILVIVLLCTNINSILGLYHIPLVGTTNDNVKNSVTNNVAYNVKSSIANKKVFEEELVDYKNKAYYGTIIIGSNLQSFNMLFDTGSSNMFIPCVNNNVPNLKHRQFDCENSYTCQQTNRTLNIFYGTGSIEGIIYHDRICFGSTETEFCTDINQGFGCAMTESGSNLKESRFDGIMGLGIYGDNVTQPLDYIFKNKNICKEEVFAFWLNRQLNSDENGGEITICGVNKNHFNGEIFYLDVIDSNYWRIKMDGVYVFDEEIILNGSALIDTGTSLIIGPIDAVEMIHSRLSGKKMAGGEYELDCNNLSYLPAVVFVFDGKPFSLDAENYVIHTTRNQKKVCLSCFMGLDMDRDKLWILGNNFIGKFYTVFDKKNKRIGFAHSNLGNSTIFNKLIILIHIIFCYVKIIN